MDAPRRNQHVLRHGRLHDEKHPHRQRALVRLQHRHPTALVAARRGGRRGMGGTRQSRTKSTLPHLLRNHQAAEDARNMRTTHRPRRCRTVALPQSQPPRHRALGHLPQDDGTRTRLFHRQRHARTALRRESMAGTQMLNGYTADFFGATIIRWDEMARHFWRQTWGGF